MAERMMGRLGTRLLVGSAAGGANFMTFDGLRDVRQQMIDGGWTDADGVFHEGFSVGHAIGQAVHGLGLGLVMGASGELIGNIGENTLKMANPKLGQNIAGATVRGGIKATTATTSVVAEGTIFAAPDLIGYSLMGDEEFDSHFAERYGYASETDPEKRKKARDNAKNALMGDTWGESLANIAAMKLSGKITHAGTHPMRTAKGAAGTLGEVFVPDAKGRTTFMERLNSRLARIPNDTAITKEELNELNLAGYGELGKLFVKDNNIAGEMSDKPSSEYDGYARLGEVMADKSVSQATRAKLYYIFMGRSLPMGTVTGYTVDKADEGPITVRSTGTDGEVITCKKFSSEADAEREVANIRRQVELNSVDYGERDKQAESDRLLFEKACESVASRSQGMTKEDIVDLVKKLTAGSDELTEYDIAVIGQVSEAIDALQGDAEVEMLNPGTIRTGISGRLGVDVDTALRKRDADRTEKERQAVEEYIALLYEKWEFGEEQRQEEPNVREEQPQEEQPKEEQPQEEQPKEEQPQDEQLQEEQSQEEQSQEEQPKEEASQTTPEQEQADGQGLPEGAAAADAPLAPWEAEPEFAALEQGCLQAEKALADAFGADEWELSGRNVLEAPEEFLDAPNISDAQREAVREYAEAKRKLYDFLNGLGKTENAPATDGIPQDIEPDKRSPEESQELELRKENPTEGTESTPSSAESDAPHTQPIETQDATETPEPIGKGKFGEIFDAFKGKAKEAWDFLCKKKSGQAKAVFHRDEIGDIDLVWGDAPNRYNGMGMAHIQKKHVDLLGDFDSMDEALEVIEDVIEFGESEFDSTRNVFKINSGKWRVIIAKDEAGNWVLTAFDKSTTAKDKKRKKDAATTGTAGQPLEEPRAVGSNPSFSGKDTTTPAENQMDGRESSPQGASEAQTSGALPWNHRMLRNEAEDWSKRTNTAVTIVESEDGITNGEALEALRKGEKITGWYDTATGEVCIYLPNITDAADVSRTFVHEVVAHKGLRGMLGQKGFDGFMKAVWGSMTPEERAQLHDYPGVHSDIDKADEYVARLAENLDVEANRTLWAGILYTLKDYMRKAGLNLKVTDAEISDMLKRSYKRLAESKASFEIPPGEAGGLHFSTTGHINAAGAKIVGDGSQAFSFELNGKRFDKENKVTAEDLKAADHSALNIMLDQIRELHMADDAKIESAYNTFANVLNLYLEVGGDNVKGMDTLMKMYLWQGDRASKGVAKNADAQYSVSQDPTKVCKKNQMIIDACTELGIRQGYGVTPAQVIALYREIDKAGYQSPCPVCYVFSHYLSNGVFGTVASNFRQRYGEFLKDTSSMSEAELEEYRNFWLSKLAEEEAWNKKNEKQINSARKKLYAIFEECDALAKKLTGIDLMVGAGKASEGMLQERRQIEKRLETLGKLYESSLKVYAQGGMDGFIKNAILQISKGPLAVRQGGERFFDPRVVFSFAPPAELTRALPGWKGYRGSRGNGAGKIASGPADYVFGDFSLITRSVSDGHDSAFVEGDPGQSTPSISDGQKTYRALREQIMKGDVKPGTPEYRAVMGDEFLSQVYLTLQTTGAKPNTSDLTSIYPYEYWDTASTYETADVNGARYLEYCRRLGIAPKFCVLDASGKNAGYGDFTNAPGYWKLLIDRRMYDLQGNYQAIKPVDTTGVPMESIHEDAIMERHDVSRLASREALGDIVGKIEEETARYSTLKGEDLYSLDRDLAVEDYSADLAEDAEAQKGYKTPMERLETVYDKLKKATDPVKIEELNAERDAILDEIEQAVRNPEKGLRFRAAETAALDEILQEFPVDAGHLQEKKDQWTDEGVKFRIRESAPPKKTGKGYKVFVLKDGKLYPPMVANPDGGHTPVGVWLDADAAPMAGTSKTGRLQVKAGGNGTQGGSGRLAYRPGWHLGTIPYALQFNRKGSSGERELFPGNFVWAEVEYANDVDYQDEAMAYGITSNGKFRHSYAGLPKVPVDGAYSYRTNPNPKTDPWIITGAMKVNRILMPSEVDAMVSAAGRIPQKRQDGAYTDEEITRLNSRLGLNGDDVKEQPVRFRSARPGMGTMSSGELASKIAENIAALNSEKAEERKEARKEVAKNTSKWVQAMAAQRRYDEFTVQTVADLARSLKQPLCWLAA